VPPTIARAADRDALALLVRASVTRFDGVSPRKTCRLLLSLAMQPRVSNGRLAGSRYDEHGKAAHGDCEGTGRIRHKTEEGIRWERR
jgi:hypothetical protein